MVSVQYWHGHPELTGEYQPDIRPIGAGKYRLLVPWTVVLAVHGREVTLTIPEGYQNDGASVPRLAWTLSGLRPDGLLRAAALIHDWLCDHKGFIETFDYEEDDIGATDPLRVEVIKVHVNYKEAADVFYQLMRAAGMRKRAWLAYKAVRWFGPRF